MSAFTNPAWDLYLPILMFGWLVLVISEQILPATRRGRGGLGYAARATTAIGLATVGLCCVVLPFEVVCH